MVSILVRVPVRSISRLVGFLAVLLLVVLSPAVVSLADEPVCRPPLAARQRYGYTAHAFEWHNSYDIHQFRAGWYVDHSYTATHPEGMDRAVLIRVRDRVTGKLAEPSQYESLVDSNPGAIWLIGNEPDCIWQDDVLPVDYARVYHGFYTMIKNRDQTGRVAAGGIVQPTPLRLEYLDKVLAAYKAEYGKDMPVDLWHIHNAILNEERGGWGAEIPPGSNAQKGEVRTIDDNDNMAMFKDQIWAFRRWMARHGYRSYPLIVTEYGVLMPDDYGFTTERVNSFMSATFEFFQNAEDENIGDPMDGGRLVQRWAWFSLDVQPWDGREGFNGNLIDPGTSVVTAHGQHYASHTSSNPPLNYVDLGIATYRVLAAEQADPVEDVSRDVRVRIVSIGTMDASPFEVELSYNGPTAGTLSKQISGLGAGGSRWVTFRLSDLEQGVYTVSITLDPEGKVDENAECNNDAVIGFVIPTDSLRLPLITRRGATASSSNGSKAGLAAPAQVRSASPLTEEPGFQEFVMPTSDSYPAQVALDPANQMLWVSERDRNRIAQFELLTQSWGKEFKIPTANSQPWGVAVDAQGNVWFAETAGNKIGRLDPTTGGIAEFKVPTQNSQPWAIAVGDDGTIWFTERVGNKIGRLDPDTGQFTEFDLLTAGAEPVGIDTQGIYVWFTMSAVNRLGRLRASDGRMIEFTAPTPESGPQDVVLNPRGKPWFSLMRGDKLLFIDIETHGLYTEFPVPTANSEPFGLAMDGDVALWFTERSGNKLGRFPSVGLMRDYALPTANSTPTDIVVDGAGCAWYAAPGSNRIGRFCAPPALMLYLPLVHR